VAQNKADPPNASPGGQLPRPDPVFTGKIGETVKDSTPSYPQPVKAPKEAPNVLLILLEDVSFGVCGTFLECCGIAQPSVVNGIPQKPIEGISMRYTFDDPKATSKRTTQYFEMMVNRAIYHEGWIACSRFGVPWNIAGRADDFLKAPWELFNIQADFTQANDLAAQHPEKLKELQTQFLEEAKKYDVFPLDSRMAERLDSRNRVAGEPKSTWTYFGNNVRLHEPIGPLIYPNSHTITAEITVPADGCEGVLACAGGISGGWTFYVKDGRFAYHYNFADFEFYDVIAKEALPAGKVTVKLDYASKVTPKGTTISDGAAVTLLVNGKVVAEGETKKAMFRHGIEPFEVGRDSISPVNAAYKSKGVYPFTGKLDKLVVELK
jgi:arylsulfatase